MKKIVLYLLVLTAAIATGCENNAASGKHKEELLKEADKCIDDSQYNRGIFICNEVLEKDSASSEAYNIKARCFERLNDYSAALDNYSTSIRFDKHPYQAYRSRADILCKQENYENSLADFQGALDNAPTPGARAATFIERAYVYMHLHKFENARNDATEALKFNPRNTTAICLVGDTYSESGQLSDAIPWYEKAIEINPDVASSYEELAAAYSKTGEYKKAIAVISKILSKYPDRVDAYNNRAFLKMQINDLNGALADINRSLQLEPRGLDAFVNHGLLYLRLKKYNEACADFQTAWKLCPSREYREKVEELIKMYCTK